MVDSKERPTILAAVNGSPSSGAAIRTAQTVALSAGGTACACLVGDYDGCAADAQESLSRATRAAVCAEAKVLDFPDFYDDDDAGKAHAICAEAMGRNARLIVVGRHEKRRFASLEGTVTERLLRESRRPVLIATEARDAPYARIIVAVDFSAYSSAAAAATREIAPDAAVTLVHAHEASLPQRLSGLGPSPEQTTAREDRLRVLAEGMGGADLIVRDGTPRDVLPSVRDELNADLIVLGTRGRTGLARAVLGSVAAAFVQDPPCDVLLVPAALS